MKIGLCIHYAIKNVCRFIKDAEKDKFDFVDFTIDHPDMIKDTGNIIKTLKKTNLSTGIQTPWEGVFFSSSWEHTNKASADIILQCNKFADKINSQYLNIHLRDDMHKFAYRFNLIDRKVKSVIEYIKILKRKIKNKYITIEVPDGGLYTDLELFKQIIFETDSYVCFDTGHVMKNSNNNFKKFSKWVDIFKDKIKTAHLSGTNIKGIPHYYPTKKQIALFRDTFNSLENLEYCMFEFFRGFNEKDIRKRQLKIKELLIQ